MTTKAFPQECDIVATLSPKEGKLDRVVELLTDLTSSVQKNEPGVFSFHLYKDFDAETGKEQLVLVEKYADKAAYDLHAELPEFQAMHKKFREEELMERPIVIKSVKPLVGFYRN
ncbi:antibiotic biosynthesis monooxygenase [Diplodia corticola]|uniref:Antibiotic biosynthesis monooxygenase n=1 Tax=Diplodia corticola TaxID=236234 RepID=A0A1J9SKX9_9PEZI|nr:antibiotic biosynthesis monooxygenase [Diplodia corticola]OJD40277.1 antibiotic biosynthesis monooxygenase [Diplodia corticola]